jgi:hypothetical protein
LIVITLMDPYMTAFNTSLQQHQTAAVVWAGSAGGKVGWFWLSIVLCESE